MKRLTIAIGCLCLALRLAAPSVVYAQWQENGAPVCTNSFGQEVVHAAADGQGGAYIVWRDARLGNYDIYAQRIDAYGNPIWSVDGEGICIEGDLQDRPRVVADGLGGCIIAWTDFRGTGIDIYAQRLDGTGNPQWTANGALVCGATSTQDQVDLISDGAGGAILVWIDERTYGTTMVDIYAQRINSSGVAQWTANDVAICTAANSQMEPEIVSDDAGGAWIVWQDYRNGSHMDIWVNRIDAGGTTTWTASGYGICTESGNQWAPQICGDGYGGFYAAWYDYRGVSYSDIYAQGIKSNYALRWTSGGIAVCAASQNQDSPVLTTDGEGGIIVAWRDFRNSDYDIYAQRMSLGGTAQWTSNGVAICTMLDIQNYPRIVSDASGGAIVSWVDSRNGYSDIYCQRISGAGTPQWTSDGLVVCDAANNQSDAWPVVDGAGGVIVAWKDFRTGTLYDIYAQRIERNGYWGYPAPVIQAIRDVPGDQGGYVNLAYNASRIDPWPDLAIDTYSLWRAIDPVLAVSMLRSGARLLESAGDLTAGLAAGPVIRPELAGLVTRYWQLVTTQDANGYEQYGYALPTLFDSTAVCTEQHYFQVCAHGVNPGEAWTSQPGSGHSVDNLAPAAPTSLMGEQSMGPDGLVLTWDPNSEPDLAGYRVYRGTSEGFVPGSGNLIASPADTTAFDSGWIWDGGYYYKVSAVDIHGNESPWALLAPDEVTGAGENGMPAVTFLAQSYPNPFAGSATIAYGMRDAGVVSLRVYDVAGRLVRELASGPHEARRYQATWDGRDGAGGTVASGIYFYRLRAGAFVETRKMVLVR